MSEPDERPKPPPIEITLRINPGAAADAARSAGRQLQAAGNGASAWCRAHSRGIAVTVSIALAGLVVGLIGGSGRALGVVAAGVLVNGALRLKAHYSPLIRD